MKIVKKLIKAFIRFIFRRNKKLNTKENDMDDYNIIVKDSNGDILGGGGVTVGAVQKEITVKNGLIIPLNNDYETFLIPLSITRNVGYKNIGNNRIEVSTGEYVMDGLAMMRGKSK